MKTSKPDISDWLQKKRSQTDYGTWTYRPENRTIVHKETGYEVDLDRMESAASILDWIMQVNGKTWATRESVGDLVEAIRWRADPYKYCGGAM